MTRPHWSIVIPAFNEARRLPRFLDAVVRFFDARGDRYEVVVADDGSADDTAERVRAAAREHAAVRLLRSERNEGKGAAVRRGMLAASGERRLFADADGATPISELPRLEAALGAGADIAIGSRVPDRSVCVIARTHRVAAGRLFNRAAAVLGLRGIGDSQCGFKAFRAAAAEDLFRRLRTRGFGFDVELLMLAQRRGYRIAEVPVNWTDQAGSKSGVLTDGPRMLWDIVVARLRLEHQ